jgi:hypothetical protein
MNHCCTYFDRGYLAQGLAMWTSLARHDAGAVLWVLALDDETAEVLRAQHEPRLRIVELATLLAADGDLAAVQAQRPPQEFIFTLTPCLVRWLLVKRPEIGVLTYLDADLFFFADPAPIVRELGAASLLVVPHRYPAWHDDAAWYGRFNVGVVVFRNDAMARACVDRWRTQCLESCALAHDGSGFGDQKYLDEWPQRWAGTVVSQHPGVNAAPWNWAAFEWEWRDGRCRVGGAELVVFHFAQFRPMHGAWFDGGQLEYGIMPLRLRSRLYGAYGEALRAAEESVRAVQPAFALPRRSWSAALGPWHLALLRMGAGQFWWQAGPWWIAGRLGLGRFSGHGLGWYRRWQRGRAQAVRSRIAVVTPTRGESMWLADTVASVAALGLDCRHILVAPPHAAAGLQEKFPRTTVVAEPEGGTGMYAAINAGVAAVGDWDVMTYINDDDVLLPPFATVLRAAAGARGRALIAYGGVRLIDARGVRLGAIPISRFPTMNRALYAQRLEPVFQHGTVVTRAAWARMGGFDAALRFCGDSELLARACVQGVPFVCATGREVAAFRLRAGQLTKNRAAMDEERARVDVKLGLRAPGLHVVAPLGRGGSFA